MSVNFWLQAEYFYETVTLVLSIIVLLIVICAIFVKSIYNHKVQTNQTKKSKLFWSLITAASIMTVIGIGAHYYYRPYLDEITYVNALVRDRYREFFGYVPYSTSEQEYYQNLNHIEALRDSDLYE